MKKINLLANRILPPIVTCAGVAALLCVVWVYIRYAINIPYPDDYVLSLEFIMNFDDAQTIRERLGILLQRHSTHITVFLNIANFLDWKIFGILDLRHMILLAFLFLLAMTALLQTPLHGPDKNMHKLVVALLCINGITYGTTLLPNNSLQNYPVLALTAGALFLLIKPGYIRFCAAVLMVTLATFSAGHGMFGFVAGAVLLLIRNEKKALLAWSILGVVIVSLFFHIFETRDFTLATGLKLSVKSLFMYYVTFLGSIAKVLPGYGERLAPLLGFAFLVICLFLTQKKYYRINPFISAWILFMLITGAVVTVGRGGNAFSDALAARYTINSCILVALLYVAFIDLYGNRIKRWHAAALCFIAVVFNVAALLVSMPAIIEKKVRLTAAAHRYVTQADNSGFVSKHAKLDQMLLEQAADRNIYHMGAALGLEAPYKVPPAKILAVVLPDKNL